MDAQHSMRCGVLVQPADRHTRVYAVAARSARVSDVVRSRLRPCASSHVSFMFVYHLMLS